MNNPDELERFEQVISVIPKEARTILDVGCGPGVFLYLLKQQRDIQELGIDISDNKVFYANEVLHVRVEKGDAANLKFPDRFFDVVTVLEVLEHLPYRTYEQTLIEIARVAKDMIIVSVPYDEIRFFMKCPYCGSKFNPNYHLRTFKEGDLYELFPGFKVVRVIKVGTSSVMPFWLRKLLAITRKQSWREHEFTCPACGFSNPLTRRWSVGSRKRSMFSKGTTFLLPLKSALSSIIKINRPRWIIGVFRRNCSNEF